MHMCLRFTAKPVVSLGTEILFIPLQLSVYNVMCGTGEGFEPIYSEKLVYDEVFIHYMAG